MAWQSPSQSDFFAFSLGPTTSTLQFSWTRRLTVARMLSQISMDCIQQIKRKVVEHGSAYHPVRRSTPAQQGQESCFHSRKTGSSTQERLRQQQENCKVRFRGKLACSGAEGCRLKAVGLVDTTCFQWRAQPPCSWPGSHLVRAFSLPSAFSRDFAVLLVPPRGRSNLCWRV